MKKLILLIAILVGGMSATTQAQVSVQFNIGSQPLWGPTGYDYVSYYYMPDIDAYYDVPNQRYVYLDRGRWLMSRNLPSRFRNYDIYNGYKVVINQPNPWLRHNTYRQQYAGFRGRHGQPVIRDARDARYYANPSHPHHNEWRDGAFNDRGNSGWRRHDRDDRDHDRHDNGRHKGWKK